MDFFQIAGIAMKIMSNPELRASVDKIVAAVPEVAKIANQLKGVRAGSNPGINPASPPPQHANAPHSIYPQGSIKWLQDALNYIGDSELLAVDGNYGDGTRKAVMEFQQEHGLQADGWAGPATTAAIMEALEQKRA